MLNSALLGTSATSLSATTGIRMMWQVSKLAAVQMYALTAKPVSTAQKSYVDNFQPPITALTATSGTISLAINKIYTLSVSGATTFSLPTPTNKNVFNQIKIMMKVTGTPTINWGTTNFFNNQAPEIKAGNYDVYFDFDNLLNAWVVGTMSKGKAS